MSAREVIAPIGTIIDMSRVGLISQYRHSYINITGVITDRSGVIDYAARGVPKNIGTAVDSNSAYIGEINNLTVFMIKSPSRGHHRGNIGKVIDFLQNVQCRAVIRVAMGAHIHTNATYTTINIYTGGDIQQGVISIPACTASSSALGLVSTINIPGK